MSGEASAVVCTAPEMRVALRQPVGLVWCFGCRKRTEHELVALVPVDDFVQWDPGDERTECAECGRDCTREPVSSEQRLRDAAERAGPLLRAAAARRAVCAVQACDLLADEWPASSR